MGKRLVFLDDYQLRIGDHVMCKHHDYTYDCDVIDYGSDPDTYVLKIETMAQKCAIISAN